MPYGHCHFCFERYNILISNFKRMNNYLFLLICLIALFTQASANLAHDSNTVVGNILAEPYLVALASLLILVATVI